MIPGIFAILTGYLLGSISPAYFLGKILKGVDIRKEGSGNAGTRNVYRVLGPGPAIVAILFLIFGDLAAKYFGILYGRTRIFGKTLSGFLAYFTACLLVGFLAAYFLEVSFVMILAGSAAAAVVEVLHVGIDDNFTVGLISASVMHLVRAV